MNDFKEKFERMKIAGSLASKTLDMLTSEIKEGISTNKIDKLGFEFIRDNGGYSAPLYYRGFEKIFMYVFKSCDLSWNSW